MSFCVSQIVRPRLPSLPAGVFLGAYRDVRCLVEDPETRALVGCVLFHAFPSVREADEYYEAALGIPAARLSLPFGGGGRR